MMLHGDGVPQDVAAAFRLFQKSAERGHTGARIMLASMYAEGIGTRKDPEAAYTWIVSASLAGDQRGRERIPALEAQLNQQQIAAARERARQLLPGRGQQLTAKALAQ
jgi:TPR repeat protein